LSIATTVAAILTVGAGIAWVGPWRWAPSHGAVPTSTAASVEPVPTDPDVAESVDERAMERLAATPLAERSVDDNLALAEGRRSLKQRELKALQATLLSKPSPEDEARALAALRVFLDDGETTKAALGVLARMPGAKGPDMLYEVWTSTPNETETTRTAHELVLSKDVRPHASAALAAALDLREAERCEAVRDILPRVWAYGDRRALTTLVRIARQYPCRTGRSEQCHPCLRGAVSLHDTIETIKGRAPPTD
jgi:hypothetical protein